LLIVYLDQNKWIELARAAKHPALHSKLQPLLARIREQVNAGRLALPLTFANIYETHKINDPERRFDLAFVQAFLSNGLVIRGRHSRLKVEINRVLADSFQLTLPDIDERWFISNVFFESVAEWNDTRLGIEISEKVLSYIRCNPAESLFEFLINTPEDVRIGSVKNFSAGSERLRMLVEERRGKHAGESVAMRRRIYSALLMIDDFERIIDFANDIGLMWSGTADMGDKIARRLINEVPTYHIEREIALRLEAQYRPIEENDFRDMQSFCAVIPYAELLVGEKQFVNLARQAGLDRKFGTRMATDLSALEELLHRSESPR